jgi:hypothetical protein
MAHIYESRIEGELAELTLEEILVQVGEISSPENRIPGYERLLLVAELMNHESIPAQQAGWDLINQLNQLDNLKQVCDTEEATKIQLLMNFFGFGFENIFSMHAENGIENVDIVRSACANSLLFARSEILEHQDPFWHVQIMRLKELNDSRLLGQSAVDILTTAFDISLITETDVSSVTTSIDLDKTLPNVGSMVEGKEDQYRRLFEHAYQYDSEEESGRYLSYIESLMTNRMLGNYSLQREFLEAYFEFANTCADPERNSQIALHYIEFFYENFTKEDFRNFESIRPYHIAENYVAQNLMTHPRVVLTFIEGLADSVVFKGKESEKAMPKSDIQRRLAETVFSANLMSMIWKNLISVDHLDPIDATRAISNLLRRLGDVGKSEVLEYRGLRILQSLLNNQAG